MKAEPIDRRRLPAGAALSHWRAPDGWQVRRMDWPRPEGGAVRGSLLFAGGRADFIEKYLEACHHWHARGWNVTSFDWRSQGGSRGDIAGGHLDSLDPLVGDLAELMAAWRRQYPGPRAAVAHSMGGHLLLRTLIEKAPPLDAAVLVAPMLGINSGPLPDWLAPWVARGMALAGRARARVWKASPAPPPSGSLRQRALTSCPDRYSDELWWWEREPGFSLGPPSWGWMNAAYRSCRRLSARSLAQVRTPVLLIGTARDRLVSPAAIRRAAERILGAELLMFDDAGHEILREADTVRLAALGRVDEFLDRHAVQ